MSVADAVARTILTTSADAVVAADRDGLITFWNPGAERIFGFPREAALSETLDIIIPERLRQRHWDAYRRVIGGGASRYDTGALLAVPARRQDGTTLSIEFTITPLHDEQGGVAGFVAVIRDVTSRFEELRALRRQVAGEAPATTTG